MMGLLLDVWERRKYVPSPRGNSLNHRKACKTPLGAHFLKVPYVFHVLCFSNSKSLTS